MSEAERRRRRKLYQIAHADAEYERTRIWRATHPERCRQHRAAYRARVNKWQVGSTVWFEIIKGHWIPGTLAAKTRTQATVQLATCTEQVTFRSGRLRPTPPTAAMAVNSL